MCLQERRAAAVRGRGLGCGPAEPQQRPPPGRPQGPPRARPPRLSGGGGGGHLPQTIYIYTHTCIYTHTFNCSERVFFNYYYIIDWGGGHTTRHPNPNPCCAVSYCNSQGSTRGVGGRSRGPAGASAAGLAHSHPAAAPAPAAPCRRCRASGWLGPERKVLADKLQYKTLYDLK